MKSYLVELESRVHAIKNRSEVLKMREEISKFIETPEFKQLPEAGRDLVVELLTKVHSKEEQFKGCDPITLVSRPGGLEK